MDCIAKDDVELIPLTTSTSLAAENLPSPRAKSDCSNECAVIALSHTPILRLNSWYSFASTLFPAA